MRTILLTAILLGPVAALINSGIQARHLREFLTRTPSLESAVDLDAFRRLAGRQMRAALVQIVLLAAAPVCFGWGVLQGHLGAGDFVWVLLPAVVVILVSRSIRRLELRAWSLPATDPGLTAERDRIVRVWRTKALPDW